MNHKKIIAWIITAIVIAAVAITIVAMNTRDKAAKEAEQALQALDAAATIDSPEVAPPSANPVQTGNNPFEKTNPFSPSNYENPFN